LRRALAQARAPAARRQLQGARHVQPDALAADPPAGVVIASGGNAGIAVACAAQALGVRCEVFVPEVCSPAKQAKLAQLGAHVTVGGSGYAEALQASLRRQQQSGALADARIRPAGGRGRRRHARGRGRGRGRPARSRARQRRRRRADRRHRGLVREPLPVEALEPVLAPTLHRARAEGRPVDVDVAGIAADSLGARRIGSIAWRVAQQHVAASHVLDDAAIRTAQLALWTELRLAVEPAAALGLAALTTRTVVPARDEKVLLVICGANLNPASLEP
jgi:threonine dehydratase